MNEKIEIPADLNKCHALITATRKALTEARKTPFDPYSPREPAIGILDLEVSAKAQPRALRLLEAIIRAAEDKGWTIEPKTEKSGSRIRIGDDPVTFSMFEKTEQVETQRDPKTRWGWRAQYRDTGLLTLELTDYLPNGMRRRWADGKKQRLENILGEFLEGVATASIARREHRLQWEKWHREYEEGVRQRQERERRIELEKKRRAALIAQVAGCEKASSLRQMIEDVQARSTESHRAWDRKGVSRWVKWAACLADRLDPFTKRLFRRCALLDRSGSAIGLRF